MQTCFLTIPTFPSSWNILVLKQVIRKRKITDNKVISAAGRIRHQVGNKSTCPHFLQLMMALLYVETHVRTCVFIARPTSNASYSWWWLCHTSKRTYGHTFVSPSRRLMRLQLMMTLLYVDTHVRACACIAKPTSNASPAGDDEFVIWRLQTCQHFI